MYEIVDSKLNKKKKTKGRLNSDTISIGIVIIVGGN